MMDKHLLRYPGSRKALLLIGFMTVLQAAAIIFQALYLSKAIVNMVEGTAWSAVLSAFAIFFAAFVVRHFLQWCKERIAYRFADETSARLQDELVEKVFSLGPRVIGSHGTGNLVSLALEGVPKFRKYLELFIPRAAASFAIPAILLLYIFITDTSSGVILAIVMPVMIVFLILLGFAAQKQADAQWETYRLLSRHFVDSLRGLVTLKYLGRSKGHKDAIETVSEKYRIATNRSLRVAFLSTFSLDFFSSLSVAVVAVELGLRLINGNIGLESALAILILAPEYFLPVRELGNDYHATMDGKDASDQIHALLETEAAPQNKNLTMQPWNEESALAVTGLVKRSAEEERDLLRDITFSVTGLKKIGIVGLSGAGKSTLIDLLSGFTVPESGQILINGKESAFAQPGWQEQVTYIPQHPYIFSATVAENIAFYEPEATREKITEAAKLAGLTELISRFPAGLDERIGQGGRSISGGEEQRIALARALLNPRPVMLFDEPTAHLDIETEHEIKKLVLPFLEEKLVFFATHRLHWMKEMDLILVLDQGRIVEMGTGAELESKKGAYWNLIRAQQGGGKR